MTMLQRLQAFFGRHLSPQSKRLIVRMLRWPPVGFVYKGSFRRLKPISDVWGFDRGRPVDRYYIDAFIEEHQGDITGNVLEVGTNRFTRQFGGTKVTESAILHVAEQKEVVTLIADLTTANALPQDAFDCVIVTQTLNAIFEVDTAVANIYRCLKPGGVALVTVPGISKISRYDMDRWGYYWAFTTLSVEKLFGRYFGTENLQVNSHGNVLASVAFLHGLSYTEFRQHQLDYHDPDYQLLISLRATKAR